MNLNTFKSMLRSNLSIEQENDKKEEPAAESFKKQHSSSGIHDEISTRDMSFLNSDIFLDEGTNVLIAQPRTLEDAEIVAEAVEAGKAIIVLLDDLENGMDQRILDFITGVCYVYKILPRQLKKEKKFVIDPLHKRTYSRSFR